MSADEESEKSLPSFGIDEELAHQSVEQDFLNARSFLLQCGDSDYSLWTHLNELLKKVIEDRPTNVVDYFEEYSRRLKAERFATLNLHLRELYIPPVNLEFARKKIALLKSVKNASEEPADLEEQPEGGEEEEVVAAKKRAGFLENMNLFKECGISLQIEECYAINLAVLKLMSSQPLKSVRFWGKIFGLKKDYIVAECELTDEELNKRIEEQVAEEERLAAEAEAAAVAAAEKEAQQEAEKQEAAAAEAAAKAAALEAAAAEGEEEEFLPPPPSIRELYKMPPEPKVPEIIEVEVPKERDGEGVNRKIYYVCNDPGDEWIPLPNLLPNHIIISRKIKKYFTGELTKPIVSFPVFEGTEKEYLRAQIGRISAATQISPLGYFTFHEGGEEEEEDAGGEEEEEEVKSTYVENSEFEPLPIKDLVDPTMAFWVHHTQHILKQGRTKWWSSKPPKGEEEAEGEEEEDEEGEAPETPEVGPPLLTPLSEDISLEGTPPWTVRNTSVYTPENAVALVCSNLWPGAYAYAVGKKFGNIYFGWGHKYMPNGYSPQPLPFPEDEYEGGPEIMEIDDPTPEAEEEWRLAHEKKPPKGEGEEGEEEGEEEEAGDDDE